MKERADSDFPADPVAPGLMVETLAAVKIGKAGG